MCMLKYRHIQPIRLTWRTVEMWRLRWRTVVWVQWALEVPLGRLGSEIWVGVDARDVNGALGGLVLPQDQARWAGAVRAWELQVRRDVRQLAHVLMSYKWLTGKLGWIMNRFYILKENLCFVDIHTVLMCHTKESNTKFCSTVINIHNSYNKSFLFLR